MIAIRPLPLFVFAAALLCTAVPGIAQTAVKVVPSPDLSKVPAARVEELRRVRSDLDKIKDIQTGDALAESYALLGMAYARNGFADAATVALDNAIALSPKNSRWLYARGVLALATRQDTAATGYFERAFAVNKTYLPIRTALANQKIASGDLDGARGILADYTARNHEQAVPYAMLGDIALRQKRYPEAIEQINYALKLAPEANRLYKPLAEAYTGSGNTKAAAEARAKVGANAPVLADPIGSRVVPEVAVATSNTANQPSTAPAADPTQQSINEAMAALAARKYDTARTILDGAIKRAPKDVLLLATYARVETAAGNLTAAQARATAAVAMDPKSALAQISLGLVQEAKGDDAAAQRAYGDAIRLEPGADSARFALARLLMRTGRYDDAVTQFRAMTTISAANSLAWSGLVAAQVAGGHCPAALKDVNSALGKDSKNPYLMQLFVRLASTCGGANPTEKRMALDYGGQLYAGGGGSASIAEAYALALAADGKWDEAARTQQGAMFVVLRNDGSAALAPYREILLQLQARKIPDRPWPASAEVFHPKRPAPDAPVSAAPAPKK